MPDSTRRLVTIGNASLDVTTGRWTTPVPRMLCAAHPADAFSESTVSLLEGIAGIPAACVNPRGIGNSSPVDVEHAYRLEDAVDDIEATRRQMGCPPWVFWGMSGGGWLGQLYARRHPEGLLGVIVESACSCFRLRLADPSCLLSPFHGRWRQRLADASLLSEDSHVTVGDVDGTEWTEVEGIGSVFRRRNGPGLLVSPMAISAAMRRVMPELWQFDSRGWAPDLRVPMLVLCGTSDPIVPVAHARALREAVSGSEFVEVEGGGHVPSLERRPEIAAAVRRFLADRVRG